MEIELSGNPDYHPIMQADPCVSSKAPSLGSSGEPGHPLFDFVFSWGGSQREGCIVPDAGISPCANTMAKHAFQAHFDGKIYQWEHICLVSIISRISRMVVMVHVSNRSGGGGGGADSGQISPGHQDTNVPRSNPAISQIHKNIERHTAHTIVSWLNPKQWVIVHTSELMMIMRQSTYIYSLNHYNMSTSQCDNVSYTWRHLASRSASGKWATQGHRNYWKPNKRPGTYIYVLSAVQSSAARDWHRVRFS